jgi:hypothetical protein
MILTYYLQWFVLPAIDANWLAKFRERVESLSVEFNRRGHTYVFFWKHTQACFGVFFRFVFLFSLFSLVFLLFFWWRWGYVSCYCAGLLMMALFFLLELFLLSFLGKT